MQRYLTYYSQKGGSYAVFRGAQYNQTGRGFGSIFKSIARFVTPLIRPVAKTLGMQGLNMGKQIFKDVVAGQNFKESLKNNAKIAGTNLLSSLGETIGSSQQSGSGRRAIKRKKRQPHRKNQNKRKRRKRTKLDFLD